MAAHWRVRLQLGSGDLESGLDDILHSLDRAEEHQRR
jgi:hypothetical protein